MTTDTRAVSVADLDESDDYIEPDLDAYPNIFCPAAIWRPGEADMDLHPPETDETRAAGLPRMSGEQLSAFLRAREYLTGRARPEQDADYSYWDDPYKLFGRVMILTGKAGSGKTSIVKWLMAAMPDSVVLCATTGAAALQAGGVTLDRLFGIKRQPWNFITNLTTGNMRKCPNGIIIDEASMIGERMAGLISYILKCYGEKNVILVGDWAQARPVKDAWPFRSELFRAAEFVRLTGCHRQTEAEYLDALNCVRGGGWTPWFGRCEAPAPEGGDVIRVYATNKLADGHNRRRYDLLAKENPGADKVICMSSIHEVDLGKLDGETAWIRILRPDSQQTKYLEQSGLAHMLELCVGARVLVTRNGKADAETGKMEYVNGDLGTVSGVSPAGIVVTLDRTGKSVTVSTATHGVIDPVYSMTRPKYQITGYPLRLGWAVTVHKTQGMTLDRMWGDLNSVLHHRRRDDASGMHGLAYVMLSRCRDIGGMTLAGSGAGWNYADPAVANLV